MIQVDVARLDVQKLLGQSLRRFAGGRSGGREEVGARWSEGLKAAGAKELYLVFSIIDMPGQPFVVVPLAEGAQAEGDRTDDSCRAGADPQRDRRGHAGSARHEFAGAPAAARPELSAAFGAVGEDARPRCACSFFPRPTAAASSKRCCRAFPPKLGGGPITDLTHGLLWAAAGIENAEKPALKLVAASRDAEAAKSLVQLGGERRSASCDARPRFRKPSPVCAKVLPEFKPTVAENRVTLAVDAQQAAALVDALMAPGAEAATRTAVHQQPASRSGWHFTTITPSTNSFPPAFIAARTASRS